MKDKERVVLMGVVSALVIMSSLLWFGTVLAKGEMENALFVAVPAVIIVIFAIGVFLRNYRSVKGGFPIEDERSTRVMEKAMAKAYLISIYLLLAIGFASGGLVEFRDVSQGMSAGILGMAIIFALCWVYYSRRGD